MIPIDLNGRITLITGATGELGRVMVRTFARAGADVAVHYYRNNAMAETLVTEVEALGRRGLAVQADVTVEADVHRMREQTLDALGEPDIIVNNAVIQYDWKPVLQQSREDYEGQFRSCTMHNVLMAQTFVPAMAKRGWGRVIGINTECAMQCWKTQSAYASAKRAMDGLLRVLAREVGPSGVTVNQVAPGWTISENVSAEGTPQWYLDGVPLGRRGTAQEIANVTAFLASDLASFITGAYVPVCGGNVTPGI
jgi:3-oxoacyl-[acyl-carrier protein] reductase